jgi:signal peptidase I
MDAGIPTSYTTADSRPHKRPSIAVWASWIAALSLAVALVPLWLAILRPVTLGGPAGYTVVAGPSMSPTLESGDLAVTRQQGSYEIGDVVVYEIPPGEPGAGVHIIHRVVGGSAQTGYELKGDNRDGVDQWRPRPADIVGEVRVTVPQGGDVLLFLRTGLGLAILAGVLALLAALAVIRSPGDEG